MLRHVTLGFSKFGFLVAVLQLLPNVLWVLFPPAQDPLAGSRSSLPGLEFGEHVLGIALVVMLIFLVSRRESEPLIPAGLCGKVSLGAIALYWLGWACYFLGWQSSFIIYSLVILPPLLSSLPGWPSGFCPSP